MMYMAAVLRGALPVTVESVLILFTYCLVNNTKAGYRGEWVEFNAPLDTIQVISEAEQVTGSHHQ